MKNHQIKILTIIKNTGSVETLGADQFYAAEELVTRGILKRVTLTTSRVVFIASYVLA